MERILKLAIGIKERLCKLHSIAIAHQEDPERGEEIDEALTTNVERIGVAYMLEMMDKETLKKLVVLPDRNYTTKGAYSKYLQGQVATESLKKYLDTCDIDTLKVFSGALMIEDLPAKATAAREVILSTVTAMGVESFLRPCDHKLLKKICKASKLHVTEEHTKQQLVEAFLTGKVPKADKKEPKKVVKPHKEKQEIKAGISKEDLHQHYNLTDLQDWCKDHKVKSSGNKKEIIKRIIAFLSGDKTVMVDETKKAPSSPSKKKAKKTEDKKKKKKEGKEEEEAKEEPEEEKVERKRKKKSSSSSEAGSDAEEKPKSPSKKKAKKE